MQGLESQGPFTALPLKYIALLFVMCGVSNCCVTSLCHQYLVNFWLPVSVLWMCFSFVWSMSFDSSPSAVGWHCPKNVNPLKECLSGCGETYLHKWNSFVWQNGSNAYLWLLFVHIAGQSILHMPNLKKMPFYNLIWFVVPFLSQPSTW